jgi:hypothetical protein
MTEISGPVHIEDTDANCRQCGHPTQNGIAASTASHFDKLPGELDHPGMAKTTVVTVTDDIDGSEGAETVSFSFGGQNYEIDLSAKNLDRFKKGLQPFIDSGRKVGRQSAGRSGRGRTARKDSSAIRAWAAEQGLAVSERGRIPASVVAKYEAEH